MNENQRLTALIAYLKREGKVYNQKDFVNKLNEYASTISSLKSGKRTLTEDFNKKVCDSFSQVNPNWLLKGELPMIINRADYQLNKRDSPIASEMKVVFCEECNKLRQELLECHRKKDEIQADRDKYQHERDILKNDLERILFENPKIPRPHQNGKSKAG